MPLWPVADAGLEDGKRGDGRRVGPQNTRAERDGGHEGKTAQEAALLLRKAAFGANEKGKLRFTDAGKDRQRVLAFLPLRQDGLRVGTGCESTCEFRGAPYL